jgi:RNA polymerase sigma-70 factor, ECF subfamily
MVDHARGRQTGKRGGAAEIISLESVAVVSEERAEELVRLDEALKRLAEFEERKANVVELRYFGGLSIEETAEVLKVSTQTVVRDWHFSKTWLLRELSN